MEDPMNPRSSFLVRPKCGGADFSLRSSVCLSANARRLKSAPLLIACAILAAITATADASRLAAAHQKRDKAKAAAAGSRVNEEYTAKIKEYTTEKYFLTELVDHLPA
jgi:hypothetical protein